MNLELNHRNALVCGSTQGIGKAVALELAAMGANVTLVARNEEKLEAVLSELDKSKGQDHAYICADFDDSEGLKETIEAYTEHTKINILINNTGGPAGGPAELAGLEEFTSAFNNHLICNHTLMQACVEGMKESGYGRIVNIISTSVKQPLKGLGVSNTIRGAVANWAKTLATELGPNGITVNNVLPGATNTIRLQSIIENKAAKTGQSIEDVTAGMVSQVPLGRVAEANEIANAVAFLSSPAAAYINGINVPVDGGRTSCL